MKTSATLALMAAFTVIAQAGTITNNFTANDGGFTASTIGGSNWTYVAGSYWKTAADGANYANNTRTTLTSPAFTASGGAISVSFSHFMNGDAGFDGGALAYSVNGGAPVYVPSGSFTANGYQQTADVIVSAFLGAPDLANSVFGGAINPITSTANLGTLSGGDQVRILFRFGSDTVVVSQGWRLTDFTINGVDAPSSGIPEPSTLSLLGAGAVLLFLRRRK